jgi:hypothetical protein
MVRGGKREGSGRKKGVPNMLTQELRNKINAEELIQFLQNLAEGKIEGATVSERYHAASALLKKLLPDCRHIEIEEEKRETSVTQDMLNRARRFVSQNPEAKEHFVSYFKEMRRLEVMKE